MLCSEHCPIELLPLSRLRAQFDTNVLGTVAVVRHFTPIIRASSSDSSSGSLRRVVLLSSITGQFTVPGLGAYSASKYALEALADSLRAELQHWRIHVAVVQPGQTDTRFNDTVQHTGSELITQQQQQHPQPEQPGQTKQSKQQQQQQQSVGSVEVQAFYASAFNKFFHLLLPADSVSTAVDAIELALTDSRPLARYRSGWTSLPTSPFLLMPTEIGDLMMGWWYR